MVKDVVCLWPDVDGWEAVKDEIENFSQKVAEKFGGFKNSVYLCNALSKKGRLAQLVQSICLTSRGS
ncbi:MAG: hypothetical protein NC349_09510, partial [Paenibacillus sp.]|nr:hypothetical protein [Paenibacillus sp.]